MNSCLLSCVKECYSETYKLSGETNGVSRSDLNSAMTAFESIWATVSVWLSFRFLCLVCLHGSSCSLLDLGKCFPCVLVSSACAYYCACTLDDVQYMPQALCLGTSVPRQKPVLKRNKQDHFMSLYQTCQNIIVTCQREYRHLQKKKKTIKE